MKWKFLLSAVDSYVRETWWQRRKRRILKLRPKSIRSWQLTLRVTFTFASTLNNSSLRRLVPSFLSFSSSIWLWGLFWPIYLSLFLLYQKEQNYEFKTAQSQSRFHIPFFSLWSSNLTPWQQPMSELKLRRLTEHNQRLREDLARPRVRVSEASARCVSTDKFWLEEFLN